MRPGFLAFGEPLSYFSRVNATVPIYGPPDVLDYIPQRDRLRTGLESCGLAASATALVLSRLAAGESLRDLTRQIAAGTLLRKRSRQGREHLLRAIRRRYLKPPRPLPSPELLAVALNKITAPTARCQLLLPYLLSSDFGAYAVVVNWVEPRRAPGTRITTADIVEQLEQLFEQHGKKPWVTSVKRRWAQGILSVLRDVGAVGRGREREKFIPYRVRAETFGFHLWGLYEAGLRGPELIQSRFWRLLLLNEDEVREAVRSLSERGWWRFAAVGGIEELLPASGSVHGWISNDLG